MKSIFEIDGELLPCANPNTKDETIYYEYLSYYKKAAKDLKIVKMLEIGVEKGSQLAVFAQAVQYNHALFVGLDINPKAMTVASFTARLIKDKHSKFDFVLIEGNSVVSQVQRTIALSGPYDIIHIDGDKRQKSILSDLTLASKCLSDYGIVIVPNYESNSDIKFAVDYALRNSLYAEIETVKGIAVLCKMKKARKYEKKNIEYRQTEEKIYTGIE